MKDIKLGRMLFLIPLLAVLVIFDLMVKFGDVNLEMVYIVLSTEEAITSTVIGLLIMSFVMTTGEYSDYKKGKAPRYVIFLIWLFFVLFSIIGILFDDTMKSMILSTTVCAILLSAYVGGMRMSVPVGLASSAIISFYAAQQSQVVAVFLVLTILAALLGAVFEKGWTPLKCWCATAFVIIARIAFGMGYAAVNDDYAFDPGIEFLTLSLISVIPAVLSTYVFLRMDEVLRISGELSERKSDLALANKIQLSAIPNEFPSSKTLAAYATMVPASDVGGDFYDYFLIKRNLVAFVIADVSDKGLPAALFMMKAKGVIKSTAMVEFEPDRILTLSNRELSNNNAIEQFVTVWMGVLDTDTGILRYSNAGHTPPYIKRADGTFQKLDVPKGMMMGVNPACRYKAMETTMGDQDTLFIYTDGVNEAFNVKDEEYGHDRLHKALDSSASLDPQGIVESVMKDIKGFTGKKPQSDDITMLCFRTSRSEYASITVPADNANLDEVTEFLQEKLVSSGCPMKAAMKLEIVAEEIFVNICTYGYDEEKGEVTMMCRYADGEAKIIFCDNGKRFDPVSRDELVIDEDINNWKIGGFGIHMVKNLVDHANYKRLGGRNVLTVWKSIDTQI